MYPKEIGEVVRKMKNNKSAGRDSIVTEHLKFSGDIKLGFITWVMNIIVARELLFPP